LRGQSKTGESEGRTAREWAKRHDLALAATPMSEWNAVGERPSQIFAALQASLPWLAAFALAATLALVAARALPELRAGLLLAASALAIAALAWHNRALDPVLGFDSSDHLAYVRFILTEQRLPPYRRSP
jgi:hypothetical protein